MKLVIEINYDEKKIHGEILRDSIINFIQSPNINEIKTELENKK